MRRALVSVFVVAAVTYAAAMAYPPSSIVVPKSELLFSHWPHVVEAGYACAECHAAIEQSEKSSDLNLPLEASCGKCHDIKDSTKCGFCHTDLTHPQKFVAQ